MTASARVASFVAVLAAIFALAALAGRAAGPVAITDGERDHGARAHEASGHAAAADAAGGELRVVAADTRLTAGRSERFTFRIEDAHGVPLRDYEIEQGRRMHLIVVRRDLRRFQHLHPTQDASGTWSARVTLPDAGVYQAVADFQSAGSRRTVAVDLFAAGRFEPLALPAQATTASADGYDVALREDAGRLRFTVSRDGTPVGDLQPYLGAQGHLVMLRAGDLAYQHVHPLATQALAFDSAGAAPGRYRLFLQFRHEDRVHTVAFTHEVSR